MFYPAAVIALTLRANIPDFAPQLQRLWAQKSMSLSLLLYLHVACHVVALPRVLP